MIGIYIIYCLANDTYYVGSSKNVRSRLTAHKGNLTRNQHRNIHLQRAWNLYGVENFEFRCIEECQESDLIQFEQKWIDYYRLNNRIFNIKPFAIPNLDIYGKKNPMFGKHHSEETKKKISEFHTGRKWSESQRLKYSQFLQVNGSPLLGRKLTEVQIRKNIERNNFLKKTFTLVSPDGLITTFKGKRTFCKEYNFSRTALRNLLNGTTKESNGWRLLE